MITINYNEYQAFNDFQLNNKNIFLQSKYKDYVSQQDVQFFYNNTNSIIKYSNIKSIIAQKRLDNLNAIQNGVVYKNGKDDKKIKLENYKDYYHLIFEYDANKLNQIKQILHKKFNIENVNLYQFDQKNLIYIFDNNSNFEAKINSPLFSNLNNRINNYNKENLIENKIYLNYDILFPFFNFYTTFCFNNLNTKECLHFNNIFDQNWYNRFCQNMKQFLNNQLSQ